jgi:hypothetical protein
MAIKIDLPSSVEVYGRSYQLPRRPTVIVCVDGFDPEYLERGCADGILPTLSTFVGCTNRISVGINDRID